MKRLCLLLALTLCGCAASDDDINTWSAWVQLGALEDCDAAQINVAKTCGGTRGIKSEGYQNIALEIDWTKGAGTGWTATIEHCSEGHASTDCTTAGDWSIVTDITPGSGVWTIDEAVLTYLSAASSNVTVTFPINYRRIRVKDLLASGTPNTSDVATVSGLMTRP